MAETYKKTKKSLWYLKPISFFYEVLCIYLILALGLEALKDRSFAYAH